MYLNKHKHVLSNAIMLVAILNIFAEGCNVLIRRIFSDAMSFMPDILNNSIAYGQLSVSAIKIILTLLIFYFSWKTIIRYNSIVPDEDKDEMALLQKEILGISNVSTLSIHSIVQLLQMWAGIIIGVEIIYEITSEVYRRFIERLTGLIAFTDPGSYLAFVSMYNSTHGFKYVGILIAINIGIFVTGIFLSDKILMWIAGSLTFIFMIAFIIVQYASALTSGIVWTSVISHLLETLGLLVLAVYLRQKYRGV